MYRKKIMKEATSLHENIGKLLQFVPLTVAIVAHENGFVNRIEANF